MTHRHNLVFSSEDLNAVTKRFALEAPLTPIEGGYQNAVFKSKYLNKPCIIRLTPPAIRSYEAVTAEIDFIIHLHEHGLPVATAKPSTQNRLVETINLGDQSVTGVLFDEAPGSIMSYQDYLGNDQIFKKLGAFTARLHNASDIFEPKRYARHTWRSNYYLNHVSSFIPKEKQAIHQAAKRLMDALGQLPVLKGTFGLIHGDINVGNLHVKDESITVFDFDECQYSWYIEDIAIALYYTLFVYGDDAMETRDAMGQRFMKHFLAGYRHTRMIDAESLTMLELFLKVRELIVHVGIYKKWNFKHLNAWQKDYLAYSQRRIAQGMPIFSYKENG